LFIENNFLGIKKVSLRKISLKWVVEPTSVKAAGAFHPLCLLNSEHINIYLDQYRGGF
jgi:hypothetical protein